MPSILLYTSNTISNPQKNTYSFITYVKSQNAFYHLFIFHMYSDTEKHVTLCPRYEKNHSIFMLRHTLTSEKPAAPGGLHPPRMPSGISITEAVSLPKTSCSRYAGRQSSGKLSGTFPSTKPCSCTVRKGRITGPVIRQSEYPGEADTAQAVPEGLFLPPKKRLHGSGQGAGPSSLAYATASSLAVCPGKPASPSLPAGTYGYWCRQHTFFPSRAEERFPQKRASGGAGDSPCEPVRRSLPAAPRRRMCG